VVLTGKIEKENTNKVLKHRIRKMGTEKRANEMRVLRLGGEKKKGRKEMI